MMQSGSIRSKTAAEIEGMRASGRLLAKTLMELKATIRPGISTQEINDLAESHIRDHGGVPSFLGVPSGAASVEAFPASICASINDVIVHGIPTSDPLAEGDIIGIDCGVILDGWHSDSAVTLPVGRVSAQATQLIAATRNALDAALAAVKPGGHVGDIGAAVQRIVEAAGLAVVRRFVGHGIGRSMHEPPQVPNFGQPGMGSRLAPGLTLAIEPMVNTGSADVSFDDDGWTARTADGGLSAHFEHTVAVTDDGALVLTREQGA